MCWDCILIFFLSFKFINLFVFSDRPVWCSRIFNPAENQRLQQRPNVDRLNCQKQRQQQRPNVDRLNCQKLRQQQRPNDDRLNHQNQRLQQRPSIEKLNYQNQCQQQNVRKLTGWTIKTHTKPAYSNIGTLTVKFSKMLWSFKFLQTLRTVADFLSFS